MIKKISTAHYSDFIIAVFVLAIALMLFMPLPTLLLDFLLTLNIGFSFLLLLVGLYMPNALALLAFPSLLLLTTLFRLALNVASTRLILSEGEAGQVIEAFGTFLIRGELVVGIIIFVIITIVNLLVISKGAARVSEVAARFALESLPGKQAAIDADLRSGILDATQSQARREDLRKESQLYGAMDGAMKFVQNDAIAGIFIIFTNIIGGIYQGIAQGLSFSEAGQLYTILTVGDGLVSQIPALLISICAGIVVTRVSSGERTTLGGDVSKQVFRNPYLLAATAVLLAVLALISNLPILPFATICLILILSAGFIFFEKKYSYNDQSATASSTLLEYQIDQQGYLEAPDNILVCYLDSKAFMQFVRRNPSEVNKLWLSFSYEFYQHYGLQLPDFKFQLSDNLDYGGCQVRFEHILLVDTILPLDALYLTVKNREAQLLGFEIIKSEHHPVNQSEYVWVRDTEKNKLLARDLGLFTMSQVDFIFQKIVAHFFKYPEEIFTISYLHQQIRDLEQQTPGLTAELIRPEKIAYPQIAEILQMLIRENIPVKNIKTLLELLTTFSDRNQIDGYFPLDQVLNYLREQYKRQIVHEFLDNKNTLQVFALSEDFESIFREQIQLSSKNGITTDPNILNSVQSDLTKSIISNYAQFMTKIIVICSRDVRYKLVSILKQKQISVPVVAYEELDESFNINCLIVL
jgi:type III secretion protein V